MTTSDPIKVAYEVVKLLVDKGYYAGVTIGAEDVAVAIRLKEGQLLQVKINQALAERGVEWIASQLEKHLLAIN